MNQTALPSSFGLIAWLENTRIVLPLKGVEARFDVRGDLISVEMSQIYHQSHSQPLEVLYTFPLPGDAVLYRCEFVVNDRVIAAKVLEVEEARKTIAEKKAAGLRTALVESVRDNLFELELGNLAPGDTALIRMAWVQTLHTAGTERSFHIPFSPGIRYLPGTPLLRSNTGRGAADDTDQVPDASRLSPPRIDAAHPDAAWVAIEGSIHPAGYDPARIASPTHTLMVREAGGTVSVRLGDRAAVPDRDFILRLPPSSPDALTPAAWITRDGDSDYALVRLIAPASAPATTAAHDVYFLVDRSGSMGGGKWTATCRAFRSFLENLAPQDRTWVTFFESSYRDLAEKPLPAAAILKEAVVRNLEAWSPDGGTELLPAMDHVIAALQKHSARRRAVIVLITDGQVGNESTILERLRGFPDVRVFTFGIDTAVNDAFLRQLAARQRGACQLISPEEDVTGAIAALASRLRHPVLTALQPPPGWELPGPPPADLYAGDSLSVVLRRPAGDPASSLTFSARQHGETATSLPIPAESTSDAAPAKLWARQRLDHLLETGDEPAALALSQQANVLCRLTAWVAWDESERLALSRPPQQIYQPSADATGTFPGYAAACAAAPAMALPPSPAPLHRVTASEGTAGRLFDAPPEQAKKKLMRLFGKPAPKKMSRAAASPCPPAEMEDAAFIPPSASTLIAGSSPPSWRKKLAALPGLTIPDALLDWLEQWALSDSAQSTARIAALDELATQLASHPKPALVLRDWVQHHLEPAFRAPALEEWHQAFGSPAQAAGTQ